MAKRSLLKEKANLLLETIKRNKITASLIAVIALALVGGMVLFSVLTATKEENLPIQEVDLPFDPEGPYAILNPRPDGNALILNIKRVAAYKNISYELVYNSTGSTAGEQYEGSGFQGVNGKVDTQKNNSEYRQEILFGSCSQGYTSGGAHCVFDKGVENGTLTLKIEKNLEKNAKFRTVYKMVTSWHMQKPDVALGEISSTDTHFTYKTDAPVSELVIVGVSIVNDLSGVPKLPEKKEVVGKVYAFNVPNTRSFPKGQVSIEIAQAPSKDAKIYKYVEGKPTWQELDTKIEGNKLIAASDSNGVFSVLKNQP